MSTKNVFRLNKVYDLVVSGQWITYDKDRDPGTLWSWGYNYRGQLGNSSRLCQSSPIQIPGTSWCNIAGGYYNSLAVKSDNTLWSWGRGTFYGSMGDNTTVDKSSPVQIPGTAWNKVSTGNFFSMATKTDGTLWSWGLNNCGLLGIGTEGAGTCRSSPVQVPGTSWCNVRIGDKHTLALKTDGTLWIWGMNSYGRLGVNDSSPRSSPTQVPGIWSEADGGERFSIARKTDGTLWSWGQNYKGVLGTDTNPAVPGTEQKSSPVQIPGTSWNQIDGGLSHALARKTDGTLWVWGNGGDGALGDNTVMCKSSPVQVPGSTWSDISAGRANSSARKTDGTLWSWGEGASGNLGNSTTANKSSPVQVPGTSWNQISRGRAFVLARKA